MSRRSSTPTWPPPAASFWSGTKPRPDGGPGRRASGRLAGGWTAAGRRIGGSGRRIGGSGRRIGGSGRRAGLAQLQRHPGVAAAPGAGGDLAILRLGQLPDDVEPEPDAAEPAPVPGIALHEPLEDALVITRRDADALV